MARHWTAEERARQSALIKNWAPWSQSTGPATVKGKTRSSQNACKGGMGRELRELRRLLREQKKALKQLRIDL